MDAGVESCGTVPNPEKSLCPVPGQTGLSRKIFGTGQTGSGQFEKINVPKFVLCIAERVVNFKFHIFKKYLTI